MGRCCLSCLEWQNIAATAERRCWLLVKCRLFLVLESQFRPSSSLQAHNSYKPQNVSKICLALSKYRSVVDYVAVYRDSVAFFLASLVNVNIWSLLYFLRLNRGCGHPCRHPFLDRICVSNGLHMYTQARPANVAPLHVVLKSIFLKLTSSVDRLILAVWPFL